jgi:hypothetical protein
VTLLALGWFAALLIAPRTLAHVDSSARSVKLASLVYAIGSVVCHQAPARSFRVAGLAQPVCARCAGLYAAAPLGLVVGLIAGGPRPRGGATRAAYARRILLGAAAPTGLTLLLEHVLGLPVAGWVRAVSAAPLAATVGWVVAEGLLGAFETPPLEYTGPADRTARPVE